MPAAMLLATSLTPCRIRNTVGTGWGRDSSDIAHIHPQMPGGRLSVAGVLHARDGSCVLIVDFAAAGAAAFHPGRQHGRLAYLLESGLVLGAGFHDRHRPRLHKCVDLARVSLAGVAVEAVLARFGSELPLPVLDLLHGLADE